MPRTPCTLRKWEIEKALPYFSSRKQYGGFKVLIVLLNNKKQGHLILVYKILLNFFRAK